MKIIIEIEIQNEKAEIQPIENYLLETLEIFKTDTQTEFEIPENEISYKIEIL